MENDSTEDSDDSNDCACPPRRVRSKSVVEAHQDLATVPKIRSRMRTIKGASDQFIEDVNDIIEKCGNKGYVVMILHELMVYIAKDLKGDKDTITVDAIKRLQPYNMPECKSIDAMHISQTIFSRELPPERFGGIINLVAATELRVTTEEIEDSLRYLYGTGPYVKIANIPSISLPSRKLKAKDLNNAKINKISLKRLKSLIELRPQVVEDITEIFEKFPHTNLVSQLVYSVISGLVNSLHGDTAKIYVSTIKEYDIGRDFDENDLGEGNITPSNVLESILCTRLDEKVYCGLINLMNACYPNTSDEEIEKALEYLYGTEDV